MGDSDGDVVGSLLVGENVGLAEVGAEVGEAETHVVVSVYGPSAPPKPSITT